MAALTIRWTRQTIADVDHIYDFIAANNAAALRTMRLPHMPWSIGSIKQSTAWLHIPGLGEQVA